MELVHGDTVPTGTYLDMTAHLPVIDPAKIAAPVAVMRGEFDGIATMEDLWDFFAQLPNGDKQFSVIAGAAHALGTCRNRHAFWHAAQAFLTMPAAHDAGLARSAGGAHAPPHPPCCCMPSVAMA